MDRPLRSPLKVPLLVATLLAGAILLALPSGALADDTAVGGIGGNYYPLTSTDIRMEAETVQAVCYRHFAEYRADFLFENSGPAQTVMLGFPFIVEPEDEGSGPVGFRAWQDGRPLAVTLGPGKPDSYESYYLHEAVFPTGKSMISVTYLAAPTWTSGSRFPELMPPEFAAIPDIAGLEGRHIYMLHTGAGWAGTIGTAVVRYTLADDFRGYGIDIKSDYPSEETGWVSLTRPEDYVKIGERTYQWLFKDLEPTDADDIQLGFTGLFMQDDSVPVSTAMGAVARTITASGTFGDASSGDPAWRVIDGSPASALALRGPRPWIRLEVQGDTAVREIRIVPGRNDSPGSFTEYGRPRTVKISLSDGSSTTVTLADEPSVQRFPASGTAEWVQLDVIDSYPGSRNADVYIAEVSFGNRPAPEFESFDQIMAAVGRPASPGTGPASPGAGPASPGAGPDSQGVQMSPAASSVSPGVTTGPAAETSADPARAEGRTLVWTAWPIALFAIAGAALLAAVVMAALLISRTRSRPA